MLYLSGWATRTTDPRLSRLLGPSIMVEKGILKPQVLPNSLIKTLMSKGAPDKLRLETELFTQ